LHPRPTRPSPPSHSLCSPSCSRRATSPSADTRPDPTRRRARPLAPPPCDRARSSSPLGRVAKRIRSAPPSSLLRAVAPLYFRRLVRHGRV
jgi:hypothetical protein